MKPVCVRRRALWRERARYSRCSRLEAIGDIDRVDDPPAGRRRPRRPIRAHADRRRQADIAPVVGVPAATEERAKAYEQLRNRHAGQAGVDEPSAEMIGVQVLRCELRMRGHRIGATARLAAKSASSRLGRLCAALSRRKSAACAAQRRGPDVGRRAGAEPESVLYLLGLLVAVAVQPVYENRCISWASHKEKIRQRENGGAQRGR